MDAIFLSREVSKFDGGGLVSSRNLRLLNSVSVFDNVYTVRFKYLNSFAKLVGLLSLLPYGFNIRCFLSLRRLLLKKDVRAVFIDHSLLGFFAGYVKWFRPDVAVFVFYHNVECIYYSHKARQGFFFDKWMIFYARVQEFFATRYSDYHLVLTDRDANDLKELYGVERCYIFPSSMPRLTESNVQENSSVSGYHLYVGSNFFANIEGLCWYIENVLPFMQTRLVVVGRGMDMIAFKYPAMSNLEVIGFVDSLDDVYKNADFVVNPVFSGSGMKTKSVEAFRYSKTLLGSEEAFVGFDLIFPNDEIAFKCDLPDDYLAAERLILSDISWYKLNKGVKDFFDRNLSDDVVLKLFKSMILELEV